MRTVCLVLLTALGSGLQSQAALQMENAALWHQLAVLQRQARGRPQLQTIVPATIKRWRRLAQQTPSDGC